MNELAMSRSEAEERLMSETGTEARLSAKRRKEPEHNWPLPRHVSCQVVVRAMMLASARSVAVARSPSDEQPPEQLKQRLKQYLHLLHC